VTKHCHECDSCKRVRQDNQKITGLYQPLPIAHMPWVSVTMDLITQLPLTKDGNVNTATVVFTDKLTKMIHTIPTITKYTAPIVANIFLQNVFRFHGMPEKFLSARDSKFNSTFWKEFFRICNVKIYLSSSYHPQTDGQTEVVNKSIENYLRHFGAENQDDWDTLLVFAEFAFNNSKHESSGFTPLKLNHGYDPKLLTSFSVFKKQNPNAEKEPKDVLGKCPGANTFFRRIQQSIVDTRRNLEMAQQKQKFYADLKRRPEPDIDVQQQVLLRTKNLYIKKW
jgi:hypothetical protein